MTSTIRTQVPEHTLSLLVHLRKIQTREGLRRAWLRLSAEDRASLRWTAGMRNHARSLGLGR